MKVMRVFEDTYKVDEGDLVDVWFRWEVPEGVDQVPVADQDATPTGNGTSSSSTVNKEGEDPSSLDTFKSMYRNLPSTLKSCLHYFAAVVPIKREALVPLNLAEGLLPERDGEIIEDTAANVFSELLSLGMLEEDVEFYREVPEGGGVDQVPVADQDATPTGKGTSSPSTVNKEGEDPSLETFKSMYWNLPSTLKSSFDYFTAAHSVGLLWREALVPRILAEGLIPERDGEIIEDTAANVLSELLSLGILQENQPYPYPYPSYISVTYGYVQLLVHKAGKEDFVAEAASAKSTVRVIVRTNNLSRVRERNQYSPLSFEGLLVHSLSYYHSPLVTFDFLQYVWRMEFLVVLRLWFWEEISSLPEEVGSLVHLRYLGLFFCFKMKELPRSLGNLQKLQTLHIKGCDRKIQLPIELLKIQDLRHLIISPGYGEGSFVRLPKGIGRLVNLHTCIGVKVGAAIAVELSALTSLRELRVVDVSDDNATELLESIMKMENLVSLSLRADVTYFQGTRLMYFPPLEPFLPPAFVQELRLDGGLFEMPNWLASMENLTRLSLFNSNLSESPTLVLQFLPRLKFLHLREAYIAKLIGKEFCAAGGFPMLETLCIQSKYLVEWTEIVYGAFSHLKCLQLHDCESLKALPEDLQNISTLKILVFSGRVNQDLIRRLKSEENYKVKHISEFLVR